MHETMGLSGTDCLWILGKPYSLGGWDPVGQSQERIMKEGRGGGKECEAPTHLIENPKFTHAARVTKNNSGSSQTSTRTLSSIFAISIARGEKETWRRELLLTIPPSGTSPGTRERPSEHSCRRSKVAHLGDLLVCGQRDSTQPKKATPRLRRSRELSLLQSEK